MKWIIIKLLNLLLVFGLPVALFADNIDLYYVNGINNTWAEAKESVDKFIEKLYKDGIYDTDDFKANHTYLQYNVSRGVFEDLLETYYQLRESGQIDDAIGFTKFVTFYINEAAGAAFAAAAAAPMPETAAWEQETVDYLIDGYKTHSVPNNNKIFLVSHSQGGLFANRVYDSFIKEEGLVNRFANIQVASPADKVHARWHDYITLNHDKVVGYIPHSMSGNVDEDHWWQYPYINHNFIDCYMTYKEPLARIMKAVRNLKDGKNGDGSSPGGCSSNPNAKEFDVMLVLMSLLSVGYPLYWGAIALYRRRKRYVAAR